jgi:hypothetical protein
LLDRSYVSLIERADDLEPERRPLPRAPLAFGLPAGARVRMPARSSLSALPLRHRAKKGASLFFAQEVECNLIKRVHSFLKLSV